MSIRAQVEPARARQGQLSETVRRVALEASEHAALERQGEAVAAAGRWPVVPA